MKVMKTSIRILIGSTLIFFIAGCTTLESPSTEPASSKPPKPEEPRYRTIVLNGMKYSEEEHGPFEIWECRDFHGDSKEVLFEVGRFVGFSQGGFILYDGGSSGDLTRYQRKGINKRWSWETTAGSFSFVLEPDGTGHYYDFTGVPEGEKIKSTDLFRCSKK
ncbi:MAG: hypothetical protein ACYTET_08335 [Planctomycetota bacterium]|jgi:hypothetical protein